MLVVLETLCILRLRHLTTTLPLISQDTLTLGGYVLMASFRHGACLSGQHDEDADVDGQPKDLHDEEDNTVDALTEESPETNQASLALVTSLTGLPCLFLEIVAS